MERIALSAEQIDALSNGQDVVYTYVSSDDTVDESGVESERQQEIFVYDEESGEYQKCLYVEAQEATENQSGGSQQDQILQEATPVEQNEAGEAEESSQISLQVRWASDRRRRLVFLPVKNATPPPVLFLFVNWCILFIW